MHADREGVERGSAGITCRESGWENERDFGSDQTPSAENVTLLFVNESLDMARRGVARIRGLAAVDTGAIKK